MNEFLEANLERAKSEIKFWYETQREFVPEFESQEFAHMIASGTALAHEIAPTCIKSIELNDTETAYFDPELQKITLPTYYLSYNGLNALTNSELGTYSKYVSLALINGSLIHEALHSILTFFSPRYIYSQILSISDRKQLSLHGAMPYFFNAFNVIEDLAIEAYARAHTEWISLSINEIIAIKNSFLLSREAFLEGIKIFDNSFESLMQLIVGLKNTQNKLDEISHLIRNKEDINNIRELLSGSHELRPTNAMTVAFRANIAAQLVLNNIDLINRKPTSNNSKAANKNENKEIDKDKESETASEQESETASEQESETASEQESETAKDDVYLLVPATKNESDAAQAPKSKASLKLIENVKRNLKIENDKYTTKNDKAKHDADIIRLQKAYREFDILSSDIDAYMTEIAPPKVETKLDLSFVRSILQARTHNETPGEAKARGTKIINTRITRIATDGKIFGHPMHVDVQKQLEVIVLIDFSGSTRNRITFDSITAPLYLFEASFAEQFHTALKQAGIANSIYAHTSTNAAMDEPILYHIASFNMDGRGNTRLSERFYRLSKVITNENYDGIIYEKIARKFTRRPTRKLLIVLSDGTPLGRDYYGHTAENHTKEEISKLRKEGINVICLTIGGPSLVSANDNIFGASNNVDASKSLKYEFERIIKQFDK